MSEYSEIMSNVNNTYCHFLPAVRQGLARWIKKENSNITRAQIDLNINIKARNKDTGIYEDNDKEICVPIQLYGPGDIIGFSPTIVARTEPQSETYDFEPNYFPFIEFSNADFIWRYSPSPSEKLNSNNTVKYIRPWIVLVCLETSEFEIISQNVQGLPNLIKVNTNTLPELDHCWRWSHVQVNGAKNITKSELKTILENPSDVVTSRLMCPRRLKPKQKYSCFVLPSTELGRFAGIDKASLDEKSAFKHAWSIDGNEIKIPYYYTWDFHTGESGDFEHLVRMLAPRELKELGTRRFDCSKPGYGITEIKCAQADENDSHILDMEGALKSVDTTFTPWGIDPYIVFDESADINNIKIMIEPCRNAAKLYWKTASPGKTHVNYGESLSVSSRSNTNQHIVLLNDLTPDKEYEFTIEYFASGDPKTVNGAFLIPSLENKFQQELAALINKPVSDDLALDKFNISIGEYEWISKFNARILPSGSDIELTCHTSFESILEIYYNKQETTQRQPIKILGNSQSNVHVKIIKGLLPGKSYNLQIFAKNSTGEVFETEEIIFSMPPIPCVVPPAYGRWHYGKYRLKDNKKVLVDPSCQNKWIDQLNLDPRHRAVAGLGTQVIRKNQENLMASAWDQLGAVESANELLRKKQFGRESSKNLLNRISQLPMEKFVTTALPFMQKVPIDSSNVSMKHYLTQKSLIPKAVLDGSFHKIKSRVYKKIINSSKTHSTNFYKKFLSGQFEIKDKRAMPGGTMVMDDIFNQLQTTQQPQTSTYSSSQQTSSRNSLASKIIKTMNKDKILANLEKNNPFKDISKKTVEMIGSNMYGLLNVNYTQKPITPVDNPQENLQSIKKELLKSLNPEVTYFQKTQKLLRVDGILQSKYKQEYGDSLDPVMAAPEFSQPMIESLQEISKNLLIPGIEKIKPNTIGLLKTNLRFLESFMCGLNHEFANELLWRGYPTDQRGTYFRQFWDTSYHITTQKEKKNLIKKWLAREDISAIENLEDDKKIVILYKHSRQFLLELNRLIHILINNSIYNQESVIEKNKERILNKLNKLKKDIYNNHPNAFDNISDNVLEGFNPFIAKMIENDCIIESLTDIDPIHHWKNSLGKNARITEDKLVLIIRGDLLKRYPNAIIYSVDGYQPENDSDIIIPALEENIRNHYGKSLGGDELNKKVNRIIKNHPKYYPIFSAQVLPDIIFLGFQFDESAVKRTKDHPGKFFVIEEHISESRFGLDILSENDAPKLLNQDPDHNSDWNELSWNHFNIEAGQYIDAQIEENNNIKGSAWQKWINASSAKRARITLQKPARIVIGANDMLP